MGDIVADRSVGGHRANRAQRRTRGRLHLDRARSVLGLSDHRPLALRLGRATRSANITLVDVRRALPLARRHRHSGAYARFRIRSSTLRLKVNKANTSMSPMPA